MSDTFIDYPTMPASPLLWPNRKEELLRQVHPMARRAAPEAFQPKPYRIDEELKEYPLYREVQEVLESRLEQANDPVKLLRKVQTARLLSQMMNLPFETVFDNFDSIGRVWIGKDDLPETWYEAVWNTAKASYLQTEINRTYFNKMMGWDPEADRKIEELKKQLPPPDVIERSAATPFLKDASQFVAQQVSNLFSASDVSIAPALAAAGLTAGKGLLAGPVSVGPALLAALGVGLGTNYRIQAGIAEAGAAYRDMTDMGIEHDIAYPIALGVGAINSFIESAQLSTLLRTVPGARDLIGKASKKTLVELLSRNSFAEAVQKVVSRVPSAAGKAIAGSVKTGSIEAAQEAVQEVSQIFGEALGRHLMREIRDKDLPEPDIQEYVDRIKDVIVSTFRGTALLALPGSTMTQVQESRARTAARPSTSQRLTVKSETGPQPASIEEQAQGASSVQTLDKLRRRKQVLEDRLSEIRSKDRGSLTAQDIKQEYALVDELARIERKEAALQKSAQSPVSGEQDQLGSALSLAEQKPIWSMTKEERIEFRKQQLIGEETEPLPVAEEVLTALQNRPFRQLLKRNAPQLTDQQLDAAILMLDLHAQAKGTTFEEIVGRYFAPAVFAPPDQRSAMLNQPVAKAAVQFLEDGKALLYFSDSADFSSWVHELGHVFRRNLESDATRILQEAYGIQDGVWTEEHEERFATDLEHYLTEGRAPKEGLARIFERFARWLKRIYGALRGTVQLDPRVREVLDGLFLPETDKASKPQLLYQRKNGPKELFLETINQHPLKELTGEEFKKGPENLVNQVTTYYAQMYQGRVHRAGIGEVLLDKRSVKDSLGHGIGRLKAIAFGAVPEVIQNGVEVDVQRSRKKNVVESRVLVGKIRIQGKEYICEVVIQKKRENSPYRFYLHEVEETEKLLAEFKTRPEAGSAGASKLIIARKIFSSSPGTFYQLDPDIETIRQAVDRGEYVPTKVLQELKEESWAEEELQFRILSMQEARSFDSEEEFVEYEMSLSPIEKPIEYWEQVYAESRLQGEYHLNLDGEPDRDVTEERFLNALDKDTLQGILRELVKEGLEDKLPEPIRSTATSLGGEGLSEEQYQNVLKQIEERPLFYKHLIEDAFQGQENEYLFKIKEQESDLGLSIGQAEREEYNPDKNNREFLRSLDRLSMEALLGQVVGREGIDSLDGFLKTAAKRIRKGKRLTEGHFQAIMKQLQADTGYYRELFAGLLDDEEELRRIELEKQYYPEGTKLQQLQRRIREEVRSKEALQKSLERVQHELELADRVARDYKQETERLERLLEQAEEELRQYVKSAREESRKLQAEKNRQKQEAVRAAREKEREKALKKVEQLKSKIVETRVQYQQKIRQIRENQKTRAHIIRLIKAITRKPGVSIDIDYADKIRALQSQYEVSTPKTKAVYREQLLVLRRETQDPEILQFIDRELSIRNLKKMSLEELEALKEQIDQLFEEGRAAYLQKVHERRKRQEQWRDELKSAILSHGKTKPAQVVGSVEQIRERERGSFRRKAELSFMKPLQLFERLDGKENGAFKRLLYDLADNAYRAETTAIDKRVERIQAFMEEHGLTTSPFAIRKANLYRTIAVDDVTFTASDVMFLYIGVKNEHTEAAIEFGNLRGREDAREILDGLIQQLTSEERALADLIEQDFRDNYQRLDRAYRDIQNKAARQEEFYVPARRTELSGAPRSEELLDALIRGSGLSMRTTPHGFLEERKTIGPTYQTPIRLDLMNAYVHAVQAQEHYIAYQGLVKDLNAILLGKQGRELRDLISRTFGDEYNDYLRKYIQDLAVGDVRLASHAGEIFHRLRGNLVVAYLSYNIASILKQVVSPLPYLAHVSPLALAAQTAKLLVHPKRFVSEIRELSPAFKHRSANVMIENLKKDLSEPEYRRMIRQIGIKGLMGLEWIDRVSVAIGWKAVYEKRYSETKDAAEAARYADEVTARTQPSGRLIDLAQIYRDGGEGWKAILQFTQPLNVIWNNLAYDIPRAARSGKFRMVLGYAAAYTLTGIAIGAIEEPYPEDDEERYKRILVDAATGFLEVLPIVGGTITSNLRMLLGVRSWKPPTVVLFPFLEKAQQASWSAAKGDWERTTTLLLEALAYAKGLPASQPKRIYQALREGYLGELIGWRKEE